MKTLQGCLALRRNFLVCPSLHRFLFSRRLFYSFYVLHCIIASFFLCVNHLPSRSVRASCAVVASYFRSISSLPTAFSFPFFVSSAHHQGDPSDPARSLRKHSLLTALLGHRALPQLQEVATRLHHRYGDWNENGIWGRMHYSEQVAAGIAVASLLVYWCPSMPSLDVER